MCARHSARAGFVLLVGTWLFAGLFGRDPWKPDEAYTVGLVHSMLRTGDWVVPILAGEPFMEKPPFFFMSAAFFAHLFAGALAEHEAARLATALYVGTTLAFVALTARRLFGREAALGAVLAMMGCVGYFHAAHLLVTDNAVVAGVAIGLYGLVCARQKWALGGLLLGTGAGIAFLSKGLIGPGMLGATAISLAALSSWRTRTYGLALAVALVALAPWALIWTTALYERSPELFRDWLVVNNFGRFTGSASLGPEHDHAMYFKILPWFAMPALPLAAWGAWRAFRERDCAVAAPLLAALVMLAVLSAACNARYIYALPMLVPLSVMAGAACRDAPRWLAKGLFWLAAALAATALAALWSGWAVLAAHWPPAAFSSLIAFRPGFEPTIEPRAFTLAAAATAACAIGLRALSRSPFAAAGAWAVAAAAAWTVFFTLWLPYEEYGNSYRGLVAALKSRLPHPVGCIAYRDVGEPQRAMLEYFGDLVLRPAAVAGEECEFLLVQQQRAERPPSQAGSIPIWTGTRPGDSNERFWLLVFNRGGIAPVRSGS